MRRTVSLAPAVALLLACSYDGSGLLGANSPTSGGSTGTSTTSTAGTTPAAPTTATPTSGGSGSDTHGTSLPAGPTTGTTDASITAGSTIAAPSTSTGTTSGATPRHVRLLLETLYGRSRRDASRANPRAVSRDAAARVLARASAPACGQVARFRSSSGRIRARRRYPPRMSRLSRVRLGVAVSPLLLASSACFVDPGLVGTSLDTASGTTAGTTSAPTTAATPTTGTTGTSSGPASTTGSDSTSGTASTSSGTSATATTDDGTTSTATTDDGTSTSSTSSTSTTDSPVCGNGIREPGEPCDGLDLGGETCKTQLNGWGDGTLKCNEDCTFNTQACCLTTGATCQDDAQCCSKMCMIDVLVCG